MALNNYACLVIWLIFGFIKCQEELLLKLTRQDVDDFEGIRDKNNNTIDISNISFINDLWMMVDPSEIVMKTFAFLPIVLWGIMGNTALIYIIVKNRHLRSPTNLLVGNMAIADLLSLLIHPWVFLIYDFFQNYQLGKFGCKVEGAIECSLLLCSVMNLCAISYDRLTAIVLPQETRLTRNGAKIVMLFTWICGLLLASPLFFYRTYKERQWLDFLEKYCTENTTVINIYWHVIITMMVWLPLLIMLICYISIFIKLDRYQKTVKLQLRPIIKVNYKKKVAKTMFIVVIIFLICHVPFTIIIFYRNQLLKNHKLKENNAVINQINSTHTTLLYMSKFLIFINAGLNPVIYGLMNEKFRRVFKTTPIIKWIFLCHVQKQKNLEIEDKKKDTKDTNIESNKPNKLFVIFGMSRSPFINKKSNIINNKIGKEVTISENNNKIRIID